MLGRDTTGVLLINAMSRNGNYKHILEKYKPEEGVIHNVELKINGHVVPLVDALEDAWKRLTDRFNEKVADEAARMIREAGMTDLLAMQAAVQAAVQAARNLLEDQFLAAMPGLVLPLPEDY